MSENWNLETVADSKPEMPAEKPADKPQPSKDSREDKAAIPSVLSSDQSLGGIIAIAREARGLTREQAAKASNIPVYYLTMIETDDYSSIADQLYLLPFLRRYATFVALDPEEVASRFIRDVQRADMNPGRSEPIAMFEPRKPFPWAIIRGIGAAIAIAAAVLFGYRYYQARKSILAATPAATASVTIVPEAAQAAPDSDEAAPQGVNSAAAAPANEAPANAAAAPAAAPSLSIVPEPAPSVAAAPAAPVAMPSTNAAAAALPPAAVIKPPPRTASHSIRHLHGALKSAANVHRSSIQD